jgi:hypothetical protein
MGLLERLRGLNTRVVVPLLPKSSAPSPAQRLNPVFSLNGQELVMATQYMAAVPQNELRSRVGRAVSSSKRNTIEGCLVQRLIS